MEIQDLEVFPKAFLPTETLGSAVAHAVVSLFPGLLPKAPLANPLFRPQKIRAVYDSNPAKFKTLQNILEVEKELHGSAWPKTGATLALMWLKR